MAIINETIQKYYRHQVSSALTFPSLIFKADKLVKQWIFWVSFGNPEDSFNELLQ